jgi:hypothetical protein
MDSPSPQTTLFLGSKRDDGCQAGVDGGMTLQFQIGRHRPGPTQAGCSVRMKLAMACVISGFLPIAPGKRGAA